MQESQALILQTRYLIRKMLDMVPGTAADVSQKLSALLEHRNAQGDKGLQQIGFLLENPETKDITIAAIKERLALMQGSFLPRDIQTLTVSYCELNQLLATMCVNKAWYQASLHRWRALLVSDFDVNPEVAQKLSHPNLVYHKIIYTLLRQELTNVEFKDYIKKYGIDSFCFCTDVETRPQLIEFFKTNTIPELRDVTILGNLTLVKYLIEELHRRPSNLTFTRAVESGSVALILYLMQYCGYKLHRSNYTFQYPPNATEVLSHWAVLSPLLSYENLALIGSVELIKKKKTDIGGRLKAEYNINAILNNAARSRSLILVRYFFEHHSSPITPKENSYFDQEKLLITAIRYSTVAIVRYLMEVRNLRFRNDSNGFVPRCNALQSGSIAMLKYLGLQTGTPHPESTVESFMNYAIASGSPRTLKYAHDSEVVNLTSPSRQNLMNAAELGLWAVLKLLSGTVPNDLNLMAQRSLKAIFGCSAEHIESEKNVPLDKELLVTSEEYSFCSLRYLVERRQILPDDNVVGRVQRHSLNSCYLRSVHRNPGRPPSFWTQVLSSKCKHTVEAIQYQIHFNQQRQPQEWWSKPPLFRMLTKRFFANPDYFETPGVPFVNNLEITSTMSKILDLAKKAQQVCNPDNLVEQEQIYLNALKNIQLELQQGFKDKKDDVKALKFYEYWNAFIEKVIIETGELLEPKKLKTQQERILKTRSIVV